MSKHKGKTPNNDKARSSAASPNYDVGYGKPPAHTRFQKGQSGNPKGRPKGSRNERPGANENELSRILQAEAARAITISEGSKSMTVTIAEAVMRRLAVDAARGQPHARKQFLELYAASERQRVRRYEELLETAIAYKQVWEEELEHRRRTGATGPEPLPHPEHVQIDLSTGEVRFTGPVTPEDKKMFDELEAMKADYLEEIAWCRWRLGSRLKRADREYCEWCIANAQGIVARMNRLLDAAGDEAMIEASMASFRADPKRAMNWPD